ncbi:MAG: hypothetical protein WEB59_09110 [Thermoanaerobaculia bacterium]
MALYATLRAWRWPSALNERHCSFSVALADFYVWSSGSSGALGARGAIARAESHAGA